MATPGTRQRIFMTGASGYIGSRVTSFAIAEGYEVYGLARIEKSEEKLKSLGAVPVRGSLESLDVLRREAAAADIVIHLADPQTDNFKMPYEEVLRIGNAAVTALAGGMEGTDKPLITTSGSLVAAPDPTGAETTETSPPWPEAEAPHQRIKAEKHALGFVEKGVKVIVIRLAPSVYGHGGSGPRMFMLMAAARGEVSIVDEGSVRTSVVHVDDAARLYLLAAKKAKPGDIFNCTAHTDVTMRELLGAIAEALGIPTRSLTHEESMKQLGRLFTNIQVKGNRASSTKAKEELGWQPKEIGICDDIRSGSYRAVAEEIKQKSAQPGISA